MAFSGAQATRLGLYGGTRSLYGSFDGKVEQEIVELAGGAPPKRKVKYVDKSFFPWVQPEDDILEDFIEEIKPKKRPKLKIVKRTPDFDDTLQAERLDRELVEELQRVEKERKKRARRHKAAIMLLLS